MKKRIVLYLLAFVLLGYFVGCSSSESAIQTQPKASSEKPVSTVDTTGLSKLMITLNAVADSFNTGASEFVYEQLLKLEPEIVRLKRDDLAWSYNTIGLSKFYLRDNNTALQYFQKAVAEDSLYFEAHNNIGHIELLLGHFDKAIEEFQISVRQNPDYETAQLNLEIANKFKSGELEWNSLEMLNKADSTKSTEQKIEIYRQLLNLAPYYVEIYNNLAVAEYKIGEINEAFKHLSMAITIDPTYAMAHNNIGFLYHDYGLYDDAVKHYLIAIKLKSNFPEVYENLAFTYKTMGEYDHAILVLKTALDINPNRFFAFKLLKEVREEKKLAEEKK